MSCLTQILARTFASKNARIHAVHLEKARRSSFRGFEIIIVYTHQPALPYQSIMSLLGFLSTLRDDRWFRSSRCIGFFYWNLSNCFCGTSGVEAIKGYCDCTGLYQLCNISFCTTANTGTYMRRNLPLGSDHQSNREHPQSQHIAE